MSHPPGPPVGARRVMGAALRRVARACLVGGLVVLAGWWLEAVVVVDERRALIGATVLVIAIAALAYRRELAEARQRSNLDELSRQHHDRAKHRR